MGKANCQRCSLRKQRFVMIKAARRDTLIVCKKCLTEMVVAKQVEDWYPLSKAAETKGVTNEPSKTTSQS